MIEQLTWDDISQSLQKIGEISPQFLDQSIVVGGGAALCYNAMLLKANNPLFSTRFPDAGQTNYSKDLDFTNVFFEDYEKVFSPYLQNEPDTGRKFLNVHGVHIGFLQFGCTFDPEEEIELVKKFLIVGTDFKVNVLNPVSLFREKTYLIEKGRGKPNDHFHREIAKTYSLFEYHQSLSRPGKSAEILARIREKAPELLPEIKKLNPSAF